MHHDLEPFLNRNIVFFLKHKSFTITMDVLLHLAHLGSCFCCFMFQNVNNFCVYLLLTSLSHFQTVKFMPVPFNDRLLCIQPLFTACRLYLFKNNCHIEVVQDCPYPNILFLKHKYERENAVCIHRNIFIQVTTTVCS